MLGHNFVNNVIVHVQLALTSDGIKSLAFDSSIDGQFFLYFLLLDVYVTCHCWFFGVFS